MDHWETAEIGKWINQLYMKHGVEVWGIEKLEKCRSDRHLGVEMVT
jgi:hypothetical protein